MVNPRLCKKVESSFRFETETFSSPRVACSAAICHIIRSLIMNKRPQAAENSHTLRRRFSNFEITIEKRVISIIPRFRDFTKGFRDLAKAYSVPHSVPNIRSL